MIQAQPESQSVDVQESATPARHILGLSMAVGVLAALISLARVWLGSADALTTLVWAEDGLYPLCIRAHGMATCLLDPYAGYLSLVPRLVAWPVSAFPMDAWPLVTNVTAALVVGVVAALIVAVLRSGTTGIAASILVALLPVLAPIMRIDAINVTASVYWPLALLAALAVCFPPTGRFPTTAYAIGALVCVLTLPTLGVLLIPLAVQALRRRIPRRSAVVVAAALLVGTAIEILQAVSSAGRRPTTWDPAALLHWAQVLPSALRIQLPGFAEATVDDGFVSFAGGWVLAAALVVLAVVLILTRRPTPTNVGLLILVAFMVSAYTVITSGANNRYLEPTVLILLAAGLLALDAALRWQREAIMAVIGVLLILAWWPGLPTSPYRGQAAPPWPTMLAEARATCALNPVGKVPLRFSPVWPDDRMYLVGATTNVVFCDVLLSRP